MAIPMTTLKRAPNGDWFARKGIPKDIRDSYKAAFGVSQEERFRRPGSTTVGRAKQELRDWDATITSRIEALRAKANGVGQSLTFRQAIALVGEWYGWFTKKYEEDPLPAEHWDQVRDEVTEDIYTRFDISEDEINDADWEPSAVVKRRMRDTLSAKAEAPQFLTWKGITLSEEASNQFLDALHGDFLTAIGTLRRRSTGDYTPDKTPSKFPRFEHQKASGLTVWALFEAWVKEKKPRPQTVDRWRAVFLNLQGNFSDKDANSITEDEARQWAKGSITEDRSARTVQEVWLNAAKTVFRWGKETKSLTHSPFESVKVTVPNKVRHRETKAFTSEEIETILQATLQEPPPRLSAHYRATRRWVPWICAYTGARAGEITQLRGSDIIERDGVWAIRLTPEAGTIKTGEARTVPIHSHLIEQGFLEFVKATGSGPLFYQPTARRKSNANDPTKPGQSQAVKTRNHLAEWVREIGADDPELRPNHAWRHTFKQIADRSGISERVSDAITGHAPLNVARSYGQPTLVDMAEALRRYPRYLV
jgi:integrase